MSDECFPMETRPGMRKARVRVGADRGVGGRVALKQGNVRTIPGNTKVKKSNKAVHILCKP